MVVVDQLLLFWWYGHQTQKIWYKKHPQKKMNSDSDDNKLELKNNGTVFWGRLHQYQQVSKNSWLVKTVTDFCLFKYLYI